MWPSRLFWKLLAIYAGLNLAMAAAYAIFALPRQQAEVTAQARDGLTRVAAPCAANQMQGPLADTSPTELQTQVRQLAAETQTELAVIDAQGTVLADSRAPESLENQSSWPEIHDAKVSGSGWAQHANSADGQPMFYVALPIEKEGSVTMLIRAGMPSQSVDEHLASLHQLLWGLALSMAPVAAALTYLAVRRIERPVSQLVRRLSTPWPKETTASALP